MTIPSAKPVRASSWSFTLLALLFLADFTISCSRQQQPAALALAPEVVAVVGERQITMAEFKAELGRRRQNSPERFSSRQEQKKLLEEMVRFEVLLQKATAAGYDKDPRIVASIQRMIVNKFQEEHLQSKSKAPVSNQEVLQHYQANSSKFSMPEKRRGAVIFLRVPVTATDEKRTEWQAKAEAARDEAVRDNGSDGSFGLLSQKYSDDQATRYQGGDMGWASGSERGAWPPEIIEALFALNNRDDISPVVRTARGLYLVKLSETRPLSVRPFAEVKEGIRYQVTRAKEEQNQGALYQSMTAGMRIELNDAALNSMEPLRELIAQRNKPVPAPPNP